MAMRTRPLLRAIFLGWVTVIVLLVVIRGRHGWRCLIVEEKQLNRSSSSTGTSTGTSLQVSRKALEVKPDVSNFHYVRHLQQLHRKHHHHHHHRKSHSHGHIPQHSDHPLLVHHESRAVDVNNAADGNVANGLAGPPDPLYRYPAAVSNSIVIPSPVVDVGDGSYGYADDKRLVPTGPNPLHH